MNTQGFRCLAVLFVLSTTAVAQPLMYVDLHPLEVRVQGVGDSTVEWQKLVVAIVENRSGITIARDVIATSDCTAGGQAIPPVSRAFGDIPPRQSIVVQLWIEIPVAPSFYHRDGYLYMNQVDVGRVRCNVHVTYIPVR